MVQELKQILQDCSISTCMTALTFFPERFYMPFAENIHEEISNLIDRLERKVAMGLQETYED